MAGEIPDTSGSLDAVIPPRFQCAGIRPLYHCPRGLWADERDAVDPLILRHLLNAKHRFVQGTPAAANQCPRLDV